MKSFFPVHIQDRKLSTDDSMDLFEILRSTQFCLKSSQENYQVPRCLKAMIYRLVDILDQTEHTDDGGWIDRAFGIFVVK